MGLQSGECVTEMLGLRTLGKSLTLLVSIVLKKAFATVIQTDLSPLIFDESLCLDVLILRMFRDLIEVSITH